MASDLFYHICRLCYGFCCLHDRRKPYNNPVREIRFTNLFNNGETEAAGRLVTEQGLGHRDNPGLTKPFPICHENCGVGGRREGLM